MGRRRSRIEIIIDILEALSNGPENPTRLATIANLPYDRLTPLITSLEEKGIVELRENPSNPRSRSVHLTSKGRKLLQTLRSLRRVLRDFNLEDIL